ncbi:Acetyl-coenzyme A synthetase 1 [Gossypium arboreum]|uniref:Acetyl-coenzyme A synthetase 1 n=1 Tax=Gossypium arboreum TaxID=29729 RepID=A0A0B0PNT8_GOSAR|nr:Acetyl-coenzyme A synthetase 1 [Gossypium arboreum]
MVLHVTTYNDANVPNVVLHENRNSVESTRKLNYQTYTHSVTMYI